MTIGEGNHQSNHNICFEIKIVNGGSSDNDNRNRSENVSIDTDHIHVL
jgi:hypothetical protein